MSVTSLSPFDAQDVTLTINAQPSASKRLVGFASLKQVIIRSTAFGREGNSAAKMLRIAELG